MIRRSFASGQLLESRTAFFTCQMPDLQWTVNTAVPAEAGLSEAEIVVVPTAALLAKPPAVIAATLTLEELHAT